MIFKRVKKKQPPRDGTGRLLRELLYACASCNGHALALEEKLLLKLSSALGLETSEVLVLLSHLPEDVAVVLGAFAGGAAQAVEPLAVLAVAFVGAASLLAQGAELGFVAQGELAERAGFVTCRHSRRGGVLGLKVELVSHFLFDI